MAGTYGLLGGGGGGAARTGAFNSFEYDGGESELVEDSEDSERSSSLSTEPSGHCRAADIF